MIRLKRENVERLALNESQAAALESQGFERVSKKPIEISDAKKPANAGEESLSVMTVKELRALAKEKGLDVPTSLSKEDLLQILGGDGDGRQ